MTLGINITIRVPESMIRRADRIKEILESDDPTQLPLGTNLTSVGRISRSLVFRLAFAHGLGLLEDELVKE